jgi:hypothetical protein
MGVGAVHRTRLTGNLTDSRVSHWLKPTGVKSVQKFSIDTSATTTATITAVDTGNSYVQWTGSTSTVAGTVNRETGRVVLTNSTTVTATESTDATIVIHGIVVEYWPGLIKTLQVGTVTLTGAATATATITTVNTAKAILIPEGYSGNIGDAAQHGQSFYSLDLTNATTVTMTAGVNLGASGITSVFGFTVVEFY